MPLSPLEAANRVNEQVTVQMLVRAAKNCAHCSQIFLDSEEDHHDPKNLAVAVTETGKVRFKEMRIDSRKSLQGPGHPSYRSGDAQGKPPSDRSGGSRPNRVRVGAGDGQKPSSMVRHGPE
jgi:hypothetical protein